MRPRPGPSRDRMAARALVAAGLAALSAAAVWSGCTVTAKNYKVLKFFFDGVPDPNAPIAGGPGAPADAMRRSVTYVAHKPYAEDQCDACHASRFRLTRNNSDICLKCHAGVPAQFPQMHGPVAAAACLWCHSPHESAYASLLLDRDRKVCGQCHSPAMLSAVKTPEHADESRSCLECHFGHGGDARNFLRPVVARPSAPEPGAAPQK